MKQNGTPFFLHKAGKKIIISIGSTSWAMTTNLALPSSTNSVTWLRPNLSTVGLLPCFLSLAPLFSASFYNLVFLSFLVSGLYFESSLRSWLAIQILIIRICLERKILFHLPWFLSMVWENWLIVGGTLSLVNRILFYRWIRMYLGHLTKRVRSLLGWISPPILKLRGFFTNKGFFSPLAPVLPYAEVVTTFFPLEAFFIYMNILVTEISHAVTYLNIFPI